MLEAVNRFPSYNDRVRFLEKHGYIEEAVYFMEQLGIIALNPLKLILMSLSLFNMIIMTLPFLKIICKY